MSKQPEALRLADLLGFVDSLTPLPQRGAAELRRLHAVNEALLAALQGLYLAAPTSANCNDFHHGAGDHHAYGDECKPAADYWEALKAARAAIQLATAEATKG